MQPSLEKLRKFFRLEHENGYANTAIIGGLAKMLDFWEGEARADGIKEEVIQAVVQRLRSYDGLSPASRGDVLKGLWKRIGDTYPDTQQKPRPVQNPPEGQPQKPREVQAPREEQPKPATPPAEQQPQTEAPKQDSAPRPEPREQKPRPPVQPRSEAVAGAKTSATPAALDAKLTVLQGVGPRHAETLHDSLDHFFFDAVGTGFPFPKIEHFC